MNKTEFSLNNLLIYRNILKDEIIKKLLIFMEENHPQHVFFDLCSQLINKAEQLNLSGNLFKNYFIYLIAKDENLFSKTVEKCNGIDYSSSLYQAVLHDIKIIKRFICTLDLFCEKEGLDFVFHFTPINNHTKTSYNPILNTYFESSTETYSPTILVEQLVQYYIRYSSGIMSDFIAFRWNSQNGLMGIRHYDTIRLQDITGYEQQKKILVQNTCSFIADKPANNILLIGSPGTGKSSSVKALMNEPFAKNLRLVEVSKYELTSLGKLMDMLRNYSQKFIIFLDDLSFEEFEIEYKYLKSIIDGGIEVTPRNVLLYATSNRMHLIKETWDDRKGTTDDVHRFDTVNEKLSLSDRFGITLTYLSPNQVEYLILVEQLAVKNNITLPLEQLKAEALKWERQHNGRSGRTGQQFINHLLSQ